MRKQLQHIIPIKKEKNQIQKIKNSFLIIEGIKIKFTYLKECFETNLIFILMFAVLFSCKEVLQKNQPTEELSGYYYELEKDNISIFLPKYMKHYSLDEYKKVILSIEDSTTKKSELNRFNNLKFSKGNVYFLKDLNNTTNISIKMMEYFPFTKNDSSKLLGILSQSCKLSKNTCTKIKAGYFGNVKTKVFMAKYKVVSGLNEFYATFYAISSNYKSFIITFRSTIDTNYKKYIEKIIVK